MRILLLGALFIVSGCSSLSKEDCVGTNWQKKGYKDGTLGVDSIKLEDYKTDCAEHGLKVNSEQYMSGHKQGLVYFCTYKNGLDSGLAGEDFSPICNSVDLSFKKGFEEGYRVFTIRKIKKEEEEKLAKNREEEKEELLKHLLSHHGDKECNFDSDCSEPGVCSFDRCEDSGETCQFNSDCRPKEGRCESHSRRTSFNDLVEIKVCRLR